MIIPKSLLARKNYLSEVDMKEFIVSAMRDAGVGKRSVIGIDPGNRGGIAVINYDGDLKVESHFLPLEKLKNGAVPSYEKIVNIISNSKFCANDVKICLELVHAMPFDGRTSAFNFGKNFGAILGMLMAIKHNKVAGINWNIDLVPPVTWAKTARILMKHSNYKPQSQTVFKNSIVDSVINSDFASSLPDGCIKSGKPTFYLASGPSDAIFIGMHGMLSGVTLPGQEEGK